MFVSADAGLAVFELGDSEGSSLSGGVSTRWLWYSKVPLSLNGVAAPVVIWESCIGTRRSAKKSNRSDKEKKSIMEATVAQFLAYVKYGIVSLGGVVHR